MAAEDVDGGAAAFYGLVLLSILVSVWVPLLMHRLSKQGFSKSLAAQLLSVCLLIYAWRALEPQASRDCEDSSIRKSYRDLSRMHHPDKGGDASKFMELASAYQTQRQNYAVHGHPDGPRRFVGGFALPRGKENVVLGLYGGLLLAALLFAVFKLGSFGVSKKSMPQRATVSALAEKIRDAATRPVSVSQVIFLLADLIEQNEPQDAQPPCETGALTALVRAVDARSCGAGRHRLAGARGKAAKKTTKQDEDPTNAAAAGLLRHCTLKNDEGLADGLVELSANLLTVGIELSVSMGLLEQTHVFLSAQQCFSTPVEQDSAPMQAAQIHGVKVAVYDDNEALPDIRQGDVVTLTVAFELPEAFVFMLAVGSPTTGALLATQMLAAGGGKRRATVRFRAPQQTGRHDLLIAIRSSKLLRADAAQEVSYAVLRQKDDD